MERRADLLLSTMSSYIEAMGGKLKLVAEFPKRKPVVIKNLADIALDDKRTVQVVGKSILPETFEWAS